MTMVLVENSEGRKVGREKLYRTKGQGQGRIAVRQSLLDMCNCTEPPLRACSHSHNSGDMCCNEAPVSLQRVKKLLSGKREF